MFTVNEYDSFQVPVSFKDEAGLPVIPSAVTYTILDVETGAVVRTATSITPAASVVITLTYDDTTLVDQSKRAETRVLRVVARYGTDNVNDPVQKTDEYPFVIYKSAYTAPTSGWTTREELETLFGISNILKWADIENTGHAHIVQRSINYAIAVATDYVQSRLRGAACGEVTSPDIGLRKAVTQIAGAHLYEARGVKDTTDDKNGSHRLVHHKRAAEMYLLRVISGQVRFTSTQPRTNIPTVIPNESVDTTAADFQY